MNPDIKNFLNDPHIRNAWLTGTTMQVYVRKGMHFVDGKLRLCFDVASIVVDEEFQRQGIFTRWLVEVEAHIATTDMECVYVWMADWPQRRNYVESILERGLVPFLTRNGYKFADRQESSMFKMIGAN